jgi:protein arginine kinase activator
VFNTTGGIPAFGSQMARNVACSVCGQTFDDFRRTGLFGCSQCYTAFADRLDPVFRRVQGGTRHIGRKVCASEDQLEQQRLQVRLQELKKALQLAVKEEAYERAARLRDEIRSVEGRLCADRSDAT